MKRLIITVPNPLYNLGQEINVYNISICPRESLFKLDRFSSFQKIAKVAHFVRKFIHILKIKIHNKNSKYFPHINSNEELHYKESSSLIFKQCPYESFPETVEFILNSTHKKEIAFVSQMNLFLDKNNIIRVKSKTSKLNADFNIRNSILLDKNHILTKIIIQDMHGKLRHAGVYKMLACLRKEFYIPSFYSTVKKYIKNCMKCKRLYSRTLQVNENQNIEYKINASNIPYRDLFLNFLGGFEITINGEKNMLYILIITCIYTRAVNLLLCRGVDNKAFISALQIHVFEFGILQRIMSDQGSSFVSSINHIKKFLDDTEVKNFLTLNNIKSLDFAPYPAMTE